MNTSLRQRFQNWWLAAFIFQALVGCRTGETDSATESLHGSGDKRFVDMGFFVFDTPTTRSGEMVPDAFGFKSTKNGKGYSGDMAIMRTPAGIGLPAIRDVRELNIIFKIKVIHSALKTTAPSLLQIHSGYLRAGDVRSCKTAENIDVIDASGAKRTMQFCVADESERRSGKAKGKIVMVPMALADVDGSPPKTALSVTATWLPEATLARRGFKRTVTVSNLALTRGASISAAPSVPNESGARTVQDALPPPQPDPSPSFMPGERPSGFSQPEINYLKAIMHHTDVPLGCYEAGAKSATAAGETLFSQDERDRSEMCGEGPEENAESCCLIEQLPYVSKRLQNPEHTQVSCFLPVAEEAYLFAFLDKCSAAAHDMVEARADNGIAIYVDPNSPEGKEGVQPSNSNRQTSCDEQTPEEKRRAEYAGMAEFQRDRESIDPKGESDDTACARIETDKIPELASRNFKRFRADETCSRDRARVAYETIFQQFCKQLGEQTR